MLKLPQARIASFLDNYGNRISTEVLSEIKRGANNFVFNGPAGTGKSFLAQCVANEIGASFEKINLYTLEDIEDIRVSDMIFKRIMNAAESTSLLSQSKKVIYIEDIDKIFRVDPSILKKLEKTAAIIIFESESGEIFKGKNKRFTGAYKIIRFYKLKDNVLRSLVLSILSMNQINLDSYSLNKIIENSRGNVTSAITDIDTVRITGSVLFNPRSSEDSIFERLLAIFSGKDIFREFYLSSDSDARLFEIWLADKIYPSFKGRALNDAFERLAFADILIRKIRAQNWGLIKYIRTELTTAISVISDNTRPTLSFTAPDWKLYYD